MATFFDNKDESISRLIVFSWIKDYLDAHELPQDYMEVIKGAMEDAIDRAVLHHEKNCGTRLDRKLIVLGVWNTILTAAFLGAMNHVIISMLSKIF